ncbi:complement C1q-like protein 2 [Ostrea edulis]|uniref:complement C1q-like protein 2 n=1 Tax=Ostrea edulis TaxID=37623 RepID=UPI0024AF8985|nr:complement C1q-like protein 2 [Ostrea edulis]
MKFVTTIIYFWFSVWRVSPFSTTDKKIPKHELTDIKNRLGSLEQMVGQLIMQNSSQDVFKLSESARREEHVAFSAYKNQTQTGLNKKHIIKFEGTVLNLGHHYHPEDGIFVAPVSGVYLFHWTINNDGDFAYTNILVGGKVISTTTTSVVSGHYNSGSAMVIVTVQKDEHVWIQTCCGSSNEVYGNTLGLENSFQSTFSGTLLFSVV